MSHNRGARRPSTGSDDRCRSTQRLFRAAEASERDLHINDAMSPTAAAAAGLSVAQLMPDSERSGRLSRSNTIVV